MAFDLIDVRQSDVKGNKRRHTQELVGILFVNA